MLDAVVEGLNDVFLEVFRARESLENLVPLCFQDQSGRHRERPTPHQPLRVQRPDAYTAERQELYGAQWPSRRHQYPVELSGASVGSLVLHLLHLLRNLSLELLYFGTSPMS